MEKEMSRLFDDLQHSNRFRPSFFRPWGGRREQPASINQDVEVKYNEKEFSIKLDVQDYSEGELKVKVVEDRVVVSGKVQEKQDEHGFVSQEFSRQFLIPENVDPETIESSICAEGVLTIQGQVTGAENIEEREIPINKEPPKETKND
nr:small heat shock protein [Magelona pitelkai]